MTGRRRRRMSRWKTNKTVLGWTGWSGGVGLYVEKELPVSTPTPPAAPHRTAQRSTTRRRYHRYCCCRRRHTGVCFSPPDGNEDFIFIFIFKKIFLHHRLRRSADG